MFIRQYLRLGTKQAPGARKEGRTPLLKEVLWPSLGLWAEAGAGALKGVLFTVLFFLSLSAKKKNQKPTFWEICVQVEYRSQGTVMWKIQDEGFIVTSPY